MMRWNWTKAAWPHFTYDAGALDALERQFLLTSGEVVGVVRHVADHERGLLRIELLSDEAVNTARIEGSTASASNPLCVASWGWMPTIAPSSPRKTGLRK